MSITTEGGEESWGEDIEDGKELDRPIDDWSSRESDNMLNPLAEFSRRLGSFGLPVLSEMTFVENHGFRLKSPEFICPIRENIVIYEMDAIGKGK